MWPLDVDWQTLRFGVEIEFVGGRPQELPLLPGWRLLPGEAQVADDGGESGGELVPPPLGWDDRGQIQEMLRRLRLLDARTNWLCGLHVHVGLQPWGQEVVLPLIDAALTCQAPLQAIFQTAEHRRCFCPAVTANMRRAYLRTPCREALVHRGRPQSHRCGLNAASWYDHGTLEFRYPNGSLCDGEVLRTVELCLRWVAAVGRGTALPATAEALVAALGAPARGYPPPRPAPPWYQERIWLEEALLPALGPLALARASGEVLSIRPAPGGAVVVTVESPDGQTLHRLPFRWHSERGWQLGDV